MTSSLKHMERSHRSHQKSTVPVAMFANKAAAKKQKKNRQGFFQRIMHRMQNK